MKKLFPLQQLQQPLPETDASDFWDGYEIGQDKAELSFPKDSEKSEQEREITNSASHVARIRYEETKLQAEGGAFTQRHLESLGVTPRPVAACPFERSFPMYLIRGSELKQQSRIPKHEDLVAKGSLLEIKSFEYVNLRVETTATPYVQDPDDERVQSFGVFLPVLSSGKILKPWKRRLFISHRWLDPCGSPPHPDDADNSKLKLLRKIIRDDDYVMLDYISFPQEDYDAQGNAIRSLCWYVYHCTDFQVISPDERSFDDYLGRGWCQVELLSAFCPVLSRTEERSDGNFYLDYENTVVHKHHVCAAPHRAVILGKGQGRPLELGMIRNPKKMSFTVADDANRVQGTLETVAEAFAQGRPRKETIAGDTAGRMVTSRTITTRVSFEESTEAEVQDLLRLLAD